MWLSIIIPVYNNEKYIGECIDSIVSQNTDQCEIIIIDDGSSDGSGAICDEYRNAYPELIKVYHISNKGVANARNIGLSNALGEYVWFVDSDDVIAPGSIDYLRQYIVDNNSDFISFPVIEEYIESGSVVKKTRKNYTETVNGASNMMFEYLQNNEMLDLVADKICRREIITDNGIFFDQADIPTEDHIFWLKIYRFLGTVSIINNPLYIYRLRQNNSNSRKFSYNRFASYIRALGKVEELANEYNCLEELKDYMYKMYCYYYLWEYDNLINPKCDMSLVKRFSYLKNTFSTDKFSDSFRSEAYLFSKKEETIKKTKSEKTVLYFLFKRKYFIPAVISFIVAFPIRLRSKNKK